MMVVGYAWKRPPCPRRVALVVRSGRRHDRRYSERVNRHRDRINVCLFGLALIRFWAATTSALAGKVILRPIPISHTIASVRVA